jgi:hypothetical protein
LGLTFNALLSIVAAAGILSGFYAAHPFWKPFEPYLIDGSLFWAIILASTMNIFPAIGLGRVKTGRLWFHHYVYGLVVLVTSTSLLLACTSVSLIGLFMANTTSVTINFGRFFVLGGLALVLDDFADISKRLRSILSLMKSKIYQQRRMIHSIQWLMGFMSLYISSCVGIWVLQRPAEANLAYFVLIGTLLVTSLTSFESVARKTWLRITPGKT